MANKAKRVIGVESVKSAVLLANRNAVLNKIVNVNVNNVNYLEE